MKNFINHGIKEKAIQSLDIIKDESITIVMMRGKLIIVNCPNTAVLQSQLNLTTMNPVNP